jgi:alanine racemase
VFQDAVTSQGALAMPPAIGSDSQLDVAGLLVVNCATVISGSVPTDTIVQKHCSLHVRGNLSGNLTIEEGANVLVDGSVEGRIVNRGGRLVVHHKGLTECVIIDGPSADEADAVLKINLSAVAFNWATLAKRTDAECAAILACNAYGCGIDPVADALARSGCRTFFVTNLAEARRVRAVAPEAVIYVLRGLHAGAAHLFVKLNARPVINSAIELAEWDAFVIANRWSGGCALNVDIGENRLGLSMAEAVQLAGRVRFLDHGITLLMGSLSGAEKTNDARHEREIAWFGELRRLYRGVPASLAGASAVLLHRECHFDLVRADVALFGINPTPGSANPMLPVIELGARIVHVRDVTPGQSFIDAAPKRRRLALVSVGQADGFPRSWHPGARLEAIVGGHRCPVIAPSSLDLLGIDVTDLPDPRAAWSGEMATLIGSTITVDEVAAATRSTGQEVLTAMGSRFHRLYYAT